MIELLISAGGRMDISGCRLCILVAVITCLWTAATGQNAATTTPTSRRRVNVPPLILTEPPYEIPFREGEAVPMQCTANGIPDPEYSWLRDGQPFDPSGLDGRVATRPGEGTLIWESPTEGDQAYYQCLANNQVGTAATIRVNLRVSYLEPFQQRSPVIKTPKVGDSVTLTCRPPSSYPSPEVFWAIITPGRSFAPVQLNNRISLDPEGNLQIANVIKDDATVGDQTYVCVVQNRIMRGTEQGEHTKIHVQGNIAVQTAPSIMYNDPNSQVALRGERWEVVCIFSGNPTPRIEWKRYDAEFSAQVKTEQFNTRLVIDPVDFIDAGNYECAGINDKIQMPIRRSFNLKVESAPQWTKKPTSIDAAENETAVFECDGIGIPTPTIAWFINGVPIAKVPGNPRRIVEEKVMTYKELKKTDVAVIQCNVTNKHGYIFTNAYINVQTEPATIEARPVEGQLVAEGQNINITCKVKGSPKPLVVWKKDDEQLTGGRYIVTLDGHLNIKDVQLTDSGRYTCLASNMYGNSSAMGTLTVRRRTQILTEPLDLMVFENTEAKFTCTATTDPEEISNLDIIWMKDGQEIDYAQAQRVFKNFMDNSLTISGTITLDTGKYTCMARNGLDSDEHSAQLIVQAPPDPPTNVIVKCTQPNNNNKTEIQWQPGRENYAPILTYTVQFNTTFQPDTWIDIGPKNLSANDRSIQVTLSPYGNYTFRVLARNKIGLSYPSAHTQDRCTTQPDYPVKNPENVIGEGDEPNNLVIFWTPMPQIDHNGNDFRYILSWETVDSDPAVSGNYPISDWEAWEHMISLNDVPPYTQFKVAVTCRNSVGGTKAPVAEQIGYSGEDVPLEIPDNVSVDEANIGSTTAILQWTQVDTSPGQVRGFFRGYRVQYAKKNEWPENVEEEDFVINEPDYYPRPRPRLKERTKREIIKNGTNDENLVVVRLRHLPPFSDVVVQVRVLTKYYTGPPSSRIEFRTTEGPPGPPAIFDVSGRGSTHLDLSWVEPLEKNGQLVGYNISYQAISGLNLAQIQYFRPINDPFASSAQLTGLAPDTSYRVYLAAATSKGNGENIFLDTKSLPAGPPSPPTFQITAVNDTYIRVEWEPSRLGANPGSVFYVQYRIRSIYTWLNSPDEYQERFMEILGLLPGTTYQVRVVAKNGEGHEAPAEYQEVTTDGVAPGSYHLAVSAWFYGIFLAMLLIIVLLVVFFVIKFKITDTRWSKLESEIEEEIQTFRAQQAVEAMGFLNAEREEAGYPEQNYPVPYYPEGHYQEAEEPFDATKEPNYNPESELYDQPRALDVGYKPQHEIIQDKNSSMV